MIKKGMTLFLAAMITLLCGCSDIRQKENNFNGNIYGNRYTIETFSDDGTKVLKTHGSRIGVKGNMIRKESSDGTASETAELSSVITLTIDNREMLTCGDTLIFFEDGLTPDVVFADEETKSVNAVRAKITKKTAVIVKSQGGVPLYAFSGKKITWSVPDDLPKFTKLMVDNKAMYIHRANFQIIEIDLIDQP